MIKHGVDLADPDAVVAWINTCSWADGTKAMATVVYRDYMAMKGISVNMPKIKHVDKLPYVPSMSEIDAIISSCRLRTGVFLRLLKDTGARALEIWRLRWADVDAENSCVTITPAKGSHARRLKISRETLNLLMALPKRNSYVFSPSADPARFETELNHFARNYAKVRRRIAKRLHNPRLNLISLKTFRHWKATMEYLRTKDILHVKELLGHVSITNTMKYVHIAKSMIRENEYDVVFTQDKAELAAKLAEGYEYVANTEFGHCLRKPKSTL